MEACNVNVTFESGQKLTTGFDHLIKPSASSSSASGCNKWSLSKYLNKDSVGQGGTNRHYTRNNVHNIPPYTFSIYLYALRKLSIPEMICFQEIDNAYLKTLADPVCVKEFFCLFICLFVFR